MYIYVASSACLTTLFTVYPRNKAISTRETVDFIKLTVHARYSGVSLERREGKGREKKTKENSFSSLGFSPFSWEILDKVYARFYEPADFVTMLFQLL